MQNLMQNAMLLTFMDPEQLKNLLRETFQPFPQEQISKSHIPPDDELISREAAMKLLKIGAVTLWSRMKDGSLPYKQVGRRILFSKNELLEAITGGSHGK
jgi:hypothetical protein